MSDDRRVPCPTCDGHKTVRALTCRQCANKRQVGPQHPAWRGGRIMDGQGYVRVYAPDDPRSNMGRYMKEHTLIVERRLGRQLLPGENVHHKNGVRDDNRDENLELWVSMQPAGQRVEDLVAFAREVLARYA